MSALTEFLFPAPARRSTGAIMRWWESRRLQFNLVVGTAGVFSLGIVWVMTSLPPNAHATGIPPQVVVVFGVLANVCYFLGPAVEIGVEKLSRGRILPTGPALFRMGLTFSTGLALLPVLIAGLDWLYRVLRALI